MLIPWKAETPNYSGATTLGHFAWATLGMIAANALVFALTGTGSHESIARWGLEYGTGLHPTQWVTGIFIHADPVHLIWNMLFLWIFGMVVEGRVGWWKFLALYLGLGIAQSAIEQTLSLFLSVDAAGSTGATAIIYGLLAIAMVWAPETEVHYVWVFGSWGRVNWGDLEVSIIWMAIFYIGGDLAGAFQRNFRPGTELLHSLGALLGIVVGLAMLKRQWVDCEGWDLLTLMSGSHMKWGVRSRKKARDIQAATESNPDDAADSGTRAERLARAQQRFVQLLENRNGLAAAALCQKTRETCGTWELREIDLLQLIDLLSHERAWREAVSWLEEYLQKFTARAPQARLKLAQILIEQEKRPRYAQRVLAGLPDTPLKGPYQKLRDALERKAQQMVDDGVLELEGRAW